MSDDNLIAALWALAWGFLAFMGYVFSWPENVIGAFLIIGGLAVPVIVLDKL